LNRILFLFFLFNPLNNLVFLFIIAETLEPDVKFLNLSILSPGRPDIVLSIPENGKPKGLWFALKEGSPHSLKFSFQVSNNIVSGLKYTNTVWKTGVKGELSTSWLVPKPVLQTLERFPPYNQSLLTQWTAQKKCLEPTVLSQRLTRMLIQRRPHPRACLLEDHTLQGRRLVLNFLRFFFEYNLKKKKEIFILIIC